MTVWRWVVFVLVLILFLHKLSVFAALLFPLEQVEDIAPLTAKAVRAIHEGRVVSQLFWTGLFGYVTWIAFRWARRGPELQQ